MDIHLATLGGDHHTDIVTLSGNTVAVLRGLGHGRFGTAQRTITTTNALQLTLTDVNGDGIPDFVLGEGLVDPGVLVYLARANGSFGPALRTHVPLHSVDVLATGDLNGDGHPDVVAASQDPGSLGKLVVLLGKGNGRFRAPHTIATGSSENLVDSITLGDATGDHRADIVAGIRGKTWIFPGTGRRAVQRGDQAEGHRGGRDHRSEPRPQA